MKNWKTQKYKTEKDVGENPLRFIELLSQKKKYIKEKDKSSKVKFKSQEDTKYKNNDLQNYKKNSKHIIRHRVDLYLKIICDCRINIIIATHTYSLSHEMYNIFGVLWQLQSIIILSINMMSFVTAKCDCRLPIRFHYSILQS